MTVEIYEGACPRCGSDVINGGCQGCGACDPHAAANAQEEIGRPAHELPDSYFEPPEYGD